MTAKKLVGNSAAAPHELYMYVFQKNYINSKNRIPKTLESISNLELRLTRDDFVQRPFVDSTENYLFEVDQHK